MKQIPRRWKTKQLVLQELIKKFSTKHQYSETEINELLMATGYDPSQARKELLMLGCLIKNKERNYWNISSFPKRRLQELHGRRHIFNRAIWLLRENPGKWQLYNDEKLTKFIIKLAFAKNLSVFIAAIAVGIAILSVGFFINLKYSTSMMTIGALAVLIAIAIKLRYVYQVYKDLAQHSLANQKLEKHKNG